MARWIPVGAELSLWNAGGEHFRYQRSLTVACAAIFHIWKGVSRHPSFSRANVCFLPALTESRRSANHHWQTSGSRHPGVDQVAGSRPSACGPETHGAAHCEKLALQYFEACEVALPYVPGLNVGKNPYATSRSTSLL